MASDPYSILGLRKGASADEIRSAYRKLAKTMHPDLHPGDKAAEEKFKALSAAYDLLGDADKRARYDRGEIDSQGNEKAPFGFRGRPGAQGGFRPGPGGDPQGAEDVSDFFESFFGGFQADRSRGGGQFRARGPDIRYRVDVEFLDAIRGAKQRISLPDGRALEVGIPAGVETGQVLRLKGQGEAGFNGGPQGDALFEITVKPHAFLSRDGLDLKMDLPISLVEAAEGGQVPVPTPTGVVNLMIKPGTNSGTVFRLRGKGIQHAASAPGDLLVRVQIHLQGQVDDELKSFLRGWKGRGKTPNRPISL